MKVWCVFRNGYELLAVCLTESRAREIVAEQAHHNAWCAEWAVADD